MPALVVPFTKMHGAGNDFLVLDNRFLHFSDDELAALARRYCPRRFGVGADGLLALNAPQAEGAHFRMRYRNADGSLATMCGNGARCLARFARRAGLDAEPLVFDTDAGRYTARVPDDAEAPVRLAVPPPRDWAPDVAGAPEPVCGIWTGTEHAVAFVDDVDAVAVEERGAAIRHAAPFAPRGANANFVEVTGPDRVRVRTFEKGVEAETLACGTGALAAALAARLAGRVVRQPVTLEARGGTLRVGFEGEDADAVRALWLEGPAVVVFEGTLEA